MAAAADQFDDTPSQPDGQQFVRLANKLVELLETTKHELERDSEAAKASLATASSILDSERRSRAKGARSGALAPWKIARVLAFVDENLHRTLHIEDLSAVAQLSTAHFSRSSNRPLENRRMLTW